MRSTASPGATLGAALLEPTRIYVEPVLALMTQIPIKGMAHITGGGLTENTHRMFPSGLAARLDASSWPRPAIFDWLQRTGNVTTAEMHRVFNCGIGLVLVVDPSTAQAAIDRLAALDEPAYLIGSVEHRKSGAPGTSIVLAPAIMKRLVILISGRGSNMTAILDAVSAGKIVAEVKAVISNRPDAAGLTVASDRGVSTVAIDHRVHDSRDAFEHALAAAIDAHSPDLIVLAGFMRIFSDRFVERYAGRMINIHPSLLPLYPASTRISVRWPTA